MSRAREFADLAGSVDAGGITGRNLIINGAMEVAQRGTSTASISSSSTYVLDRTRFALSNGGTWTMSQSTTVPSGQGFSHSLKLDCTTADTSLGSTDYLQLQQLIEGQNVQHLSYGTSGAKSVTVSFWIRSNKTGTYTLEVQTQTSSNAFYQNAKAFTISSADTWEKKEITFVGNTSNNVINSNAVGFYVSLWLGAGSSRTSGTFTNGTWHNTAANRVHSSQVNLADSTSNELYLTGLQLEVGEQATPFEHRSFGDELARCQRYYYKLSPGSAASGYASCNSNNTSRSDVLCHFPVTLREIPTAVETTGTASDYGSLTAGVNVNCNSVPTFVRASLNTSFVRFPYASSSVTTGQAGTAQAKSTDSFLAWSAEL
mgnify:FL=1